MSTTIANPAAALLGAAPKAKRPSLKGGAALRASDVAIVPGPTPNAARKGTWRHYMVACAVKASSTGAATKWHKAHATRAGQPKTKPLDFAWMLAMGYIARA
jgi:hypothetical protein